MEVAALDSPPIMSKASAMSWASRVAVPLNSRCSRKWVEPSWPGTSSRLPTPNHMPIEAERSPGTDSVMTRTPPGRTERRVRAPSSCRVSSVPSRPGRPRPSSISA